MSTSTRILLVYFQSDSNQKLTYQHGWPQAFRDSSLFDCTHLNLSTLRNDLKFSLVPSLLLNRSFDLIVFLHSVFSNQQYLMGWFYKTFCFSKIPKALFLGNEYKLMPEKVMFARRLGINLLITQSNDPRVFELYQSALDVDVCSIPNTGVDTNIFYPTSTNSARSIDIGYRSFPSKPYLGNTEKNDIADFWNSICTSHSLSSDISLDPTNRFDAFGYAHFLNNCRFQIGTESGTDYFELSDKTRNAVNSYLYQHPAYSWPEIQKLFFDDYVTPIPMRIISGRQIEAAACKTAQILFEGRYSGYLLPDIHYIPLSIDFSNIDIVLEKIKDLTFVHSIIDNAYDLVPEFFTYHQLMNLFQASLKRHNII